MVSTSGPQKQSHVTSSDELQRCPCVCLQDNTHPCSCAEPWGTRSALIQREHPQGCMLCCSLVSLSTFPFQHQENQDLDATAKKNTFITQCICPLLPLIGNSLLQGLMHAAAEDICSSYGKCPPASRVRRLLSPRAAVNTHCLKTAKGHRT